MKTPAALISAAFRTHPASDPLDDLARIAERRQRLIELQRRVEALERDQDRDAIGQAAHWHERMMEEGRAAATARRERHEEWERHQRFIERVGSRLAELGATWADLGKANPGAGKVYTDCARAIRKLRRQVLEGSL